MQSKGCIIDRYIIKCYIMAIYLKVHLYFDFDGNGIVCYRE